VKDATKIPPPPQGYCYDISTFPPDSEWDYEGGYAKALAQAGVGEADAVYESHVAEGPGAIAGMHQTDTVDIVTVISGEIWMVVEAGETLLRAGDTVIQRGTWHTWRNRSDTPCIVGGPLGAAVT